MFLHQGEMQDNVDFLFWARCERAEPKLIGVTAEEIGIMKELRWWTVEEIAGSRERIFPVELAGRVRDDFTAPDPEPGLRVLGSVPEHEMPALYSSAAACVYPSFYEGFGLPVLEAMQSGGDR